jgi:riboflavin synthase
MFTGLVQTLATVVDIRSSPPAKRLVVRVARLADRPTIGASIALNGCCLTAVEVQVENQGASHCERLAFEAGPETLSRTNLGELAVGSRVNLEPSLKVGDPLGGHLVSGHIDGIGTLVARSDEGQWSTCWFSVAPRLCAQMAAKGSVAVDGVSLTLLEVEPDRFSVALIPHTLSATTLGLLAVGGHANIETDLLAKYVERQLLVSEQLVRGASQAARFGSSSAPSAPVPRREGGL